MCAKADLDHTEFLDSVWVMVCSGNVSAAPDEIAFLHMSRAALDIKCHSCKYARDKSVTLPNQTANQVRDYMSTTMTIITIQ